MKKILQLLVCLFFLQISFAQSPNESIGYYYQGKKINFPLSYQVIAIGVQPENFTEQTRINIAAICKVSNNSVQFSTTNNQFFVQFTSTQNDIAFAALNTLKARSDIEYAFAGLLSQDNKTCTYGNEFVVKLKANTSFSVLQNLLGEFNCSIVQAYKFNSSTYILRAGERQSFDGVKAANLFFASGYFEYAEPNLTLHNGLNYTPNDPMYNLQWSLKNTGSVAQYSGTVGADMNVENAWNISMGSPTIKIAVVDEGVDLTHPDLAANLLQGFNCLTQTSNIGDGQNLGTARAHGTACAGIIAARTDTNQNATNIGIAGVAPFCKIIPINLAASNGTFTTTANIAGGFDYAWQNGADVISNSWGGSSPSSIMEDAIHRAVTQGRGGKGSVVLFASGNGNTSVNYPATNPNVIAVGASSMCDQRKNITSCDGETFWGSCYGNTLDIVAPGVKIATTDNVGTSGYNTQAGTAGDYNATFNGTSSACPNAAGVAALILSVNTNYTQTQVKQILELSASKMSGYTYSMTINQPNGTWNSETGHGRVNAHSAVLLAQSGIICNVQIEANGSTRFCTGGQVELLVKNPVIGTTYQWKKNGVNIAVGNTFNANTSGNYSVEATYTNNCVATSSSIAVTELNNAIPLVARAGTDKTICSGASIFLGDTTVASGGAPFLAQKRIFGMNWFDNSFIKFAHESPETFDTIALNMLPLTEFNNSQFYRGGTFTPYGYYVITSGTNKLIKIDTVSGTQTLIGNPVPTNGFWSGLSWDRTTKKLYAVSSFGTNSRLSILNIFTGAVESTITVSLSRILSIAFDKSGRLFASRSDNNSNSFESIYEIDKTTGSFIALTNNLGTSIEFAQDADYDPIQEKLYLTAITNYQRNGSPLIEVNTNNGSATIIGQMGGFAEIDATAIADYQYTYSWSPSIGLNNTTVATPLANPTTTTTYTLTVSDMCGNTATDEVVVNVVENGTWLGTTSNSWHVSSNWCGGVPTATTEVKIPSNVPNYPTVTSGTYQVKSLTLGSGAFLSLNSGCNLQVLESTTNNGSINGLGILQLVGSVPQTIAGNGFYNNLTIINSTGVTIENDINTKVNIVNNLQLNGLSTLNTNNNLILKSSSLRTANVGTANAAGNYITGNTLVERFIPGGYRKFRFLGHPFSSNLSISDITDEMDITGTITGSNANGFTSTTSNASSAYTFSESLDDGSIAGWQAISSGNIATQITPGNGLRVLVRGSKGQSGSLTGGIYTPDSVILKMTGTLRQGDFTQPLSFTNINKGWNLISNPYPSNIDWNGVTRNNVNNAVYTYRPSLNGGVYASYVNNSSTNGGSNIIEAHNAFFVRANDVNPSLQFHETDKTTQSQPNSMFRGLGDMHSKIQLTLFKTNSTEKDEIIVRFGIDEATNYFDQSFDAENLNGGMNDLFALDENAKRYSIYHGEELRAFEKYREVKLGFSISSVGEYVIEAKTLYPFLHGYQAYLKDGYNNTITTITDSMQYSFVAQQAGVINSRLSIVFSNQKSPTPITKATMFVSPNPASSSFEVFCIAFNKLANTHISIKDINGRTLQRKAVGKISTGSVLMNSTTLPNGVYLVEVLNGSERFIQKLIKQ
jgi:subtilisin family serine protease